MLELGRLPVDGKWEVPIESETVGTSFILKFIVPFFFPSHLESNTMADRLLTLYSDFAECGRKYGKVFTLFAEARDFAVDHTSLLDVDIVPLGQNGIAILILDGESQPSGLDFISTPEQFPSEFPFVILATPNCGYAEKVQEGLEKCGATPLMRLRKLVDLPSDFTRWMTDLWVALEKGGLSSRFPQRYVVEARDEVSPTPKPKSYHASKVVENKLLTAPEYPRPSYLLTLDIEGSGLKYSTGDHVVILPVNDDDVVERALRVLRLTGEEIVEIFGLNNVKVETYPSRGVDVKTLLKYYVNIQGLATRKFLATAALLAADEKEAAELTQMATDLTKDSTYSQAVKGVFSFVDALQRFPSVQLTLGQALSILAPIKPRSYSASCSPLRDLNQVQCVYTVISYPTSSGAVFKGQATTYMSHLKPGDQVHMTIKKGFKEVEVDGENTKYLGVALGSGVAMLRGITQHFHCLRTIEKKQAGKMLLYYGVRHQKQDFFFADEFETYKSTGSLQLVTAFSHDQDEFISTLR